jgi:uncharacterized damage-inducible protein DinB
MVMSVEALFTDWAARKLEQSAGRIEACLNRLDDEKIWLRGSDNENAVGNLVLHVCGNVRQWIGFGVAGKPDVRARDREFSARGGITREELVERLRVTVGGAAEIIRGLPAGRLAERTTVQNYDISVLEAIAHAVEHFAHHTGQIIFATKALTGEDMGFYRHLSGSQPPPPAADKTP